MSTPCAHFALLKQRVEDLSIKFVADQIHSELADPAGYQPDLDRLAAYRLLVHAELEEFLESKARDNIDSITIRMGSASTWMRLSPELLALAIGLKRTLPEQDILDLSRHCSFVIDMLAAARKAIAENNGVKLQSFALLSLCAGKTMDEIDGVLAASLNSYGKSRGDVAHRSVTRSQSLQAPSSEAATARALVEQIAVYFDVTA
jgi:hypothetical protein